MSTNTMASAQSPAATHTEKKATGSIWILASWKDLLLFVGTPLLLLPLIPMTMKWSLITVEQFSIFALAFASTGHHLPGMIRAYGDRQLFQRYRVRFIVAPIFLVTICMVSFSLEMQGLRLLFLLWGFWHAVMQVYGFARIYDAKVRMFDRVTARLDWLMCLAWFSAGIVFSPERVSLFFEEFFLAGGPQIGMGFISVLQNIWAGFLTIVTLAFVANMVWRVRHGAQISLAKILLFAISFGFWWFVMVTIENVIMGVAIWEIFHDIQYLSIVWVFNRNRVDKDNRVGSFTQFLFRRSWLMIGLYTGMVAAYGFFGFATKARMFIDHETVTRLLLGVIAASGFLHFYFDGFIWKVRERSTRESLGLKGGKPDGTGTGLVPVWVRHGMLWTIFIVPLGMLWTWPAAEKLDVYRHLTIAMPNVAQYHTKLGAAWQRSGDAVKAEMALRHAIKIDADSYEAHEILGAALLVQNRVDDAIQSLAAALRLKTRLPESHYRMGFALGQRKDYDGAIASYKRAIELEPDHALAHYAMGAAHAAKGDMARAASSFRRVIKMDPVDTPNAKADAETALEQVLQFQRSQKKNSPRP